MHPGFRVMCRNMVDDPRKYNTVEGPASQPRPLKLIKDRANHDTWGGNNKAGVVRGVMFMGSCKGDTILYWLRHLKEQKKINFELIMKSRMKR